MNLHIHHDSPTTPSGISSRLYLLLILLLCGAGIFCAWCLQDTLFIAPAIGSVIVLLLLSKATLSDSQRWRSWLGIFQFLASWLVFPLFKAIHLISTHSYDAQLLAFDRWLWGGVGATEYVKVLEAPWLSELMSSCYLAFYFIILGPVIAYGFKRHSASSKGFFYGLMLMYLVGFTGYLLVPAAGPYVYAPALFPYPPQGGAITAFLVGLVAQGGTGMDVFPSLHCGISLYILGYLTFQRHWIIAGLLLPVVVGLILATLYLRYHYGVDLLAGTLVAGSVLTWLNRQGYFRRSTGTLI